MIVNASRALICGLALTGLSIAQCPPPGGYAPPAPPAPPIQNKAVTGQAGSPSAGSPAAPKPAGPTTPRPNGPSAPGPQQKGPVTPRMGQPAARGPAPATGPRGMPISFERGHTSKDRLKVDWVHPVPPERTGEKTSAAGPLNLQAALDELWSEDDGRPLLVLRECRLCEGSDGALFSRSLANDKTMLITKWFRTVKLPAHVAEAGHPFHNVFQAFDFKDGWPHFFLLAHPGATPVAFTGQQTQSQLWKGMFDVLEQRYAKDPKKAIKQWLAVLDKYDTLDGRQHDLQEELFAVRAEQGPESSRAQKLQKELDAIAKERAENEELEKKVSDLGLLEMQKVAAK